MARSLIPRPIVACAGCPHSGAKSGVGGATFPAASYRAARMRLRKGGTALAVGALAAVLAAGCGAKTDVSKGVEDFNQDLEPNGLTLECPKEIKGGEGTVFDCTLRGTRNGKSAPVQLKIAKEEGDLVIDAADQKAFDVARQEVAGG